MPRRDVRPRTDPTPCRGRALRSAPAASSRCRSSGQLPVLVDVADRRARIAALIEQSGQIVVRFGELWIELERAVVERDGIGFLAGILRDHAEVVVRGGIRGIEV